MPELPVPRGVPKYAIPKQERERLRRRALRAQKNGQREICGLLAATADNLIVLRFMQNETSKPGKYLITLKAYREEAAQARRLGLRVLGTFHSHPIWYAVPGTRDKRGWHGRYMLLYDVCALDARLWLRTRRKGRRAYVNVPLAVVSE